MLIHNERSIAIKPNYEGAHLYHRQRLRFVCKHWSAQQLRDEFLPTEIAWMTQLKPTQEEWLAAAHHAYLVQLLNMGELSKWRQTLLSEAPETIEAVAQVLLTLRRFYPLHLMGINTDRTLLPPPFAQLQEAQPLAQIKEHPFRSNVPLFGRFIAAFRQRWNRVSTEWYVKPMIQQQSAFNTLLLSALNQNREQQQQQVAIQLRTAEAVTEYLQGHASEMSELAQEVESLKRRVCNVNPCPPTARTIRYNLFMRVVFFTHTFVPDYVGGAEVSLYHTCHGLQARGVDCLVLTANSRGRGREDQWYEVDGIPVHRFTWRTKRAPRLHRSL